jgi:predicted deacetylase
MPVEELINGHLDMDPLYEFNYLHAKTANLRLRVQLNCIILLHKCNLILNGLMCKRYQISHRCVGESTNLLRFDFLAVGSDELAGCKLIRNVCKYRY